MKSITKIIQRWKNKSRAPPGYVPILVGAQRKRFIVKTRFLNYPVFAAQFDEVEVEFGFPSEGCLVLPCQPGLFEGIVRFLEKDEDKFSGLGLHEFLKMVKDEFTYNNESCHALTTPLLQEARSDVIF